MKPSKAVITAAGPGQQQVPLQTLIDRDGEPCSALAVQLSELAGAGVEAVAVVIGREMDESLYRSAAGESGLNLSFIPQPAGRRGFGHAILAASDFVGEESFLLMVGDHIYVSDDPARSCAAQLSELAAEEDCLISAVQATHESQLRQFGAIGGRPAAGRAGCYEVTTVREKPTPTLAEQELMVAGQRVAHYLCFFGLHVLTPELMAELRRQSERLGKDEPLGLSPALDASVQRGKYLAAQLQGKRFNLEQRYGLLKAQVAIGLSGGHRDELLTEIVELLAALRP